MSEQTPTTQKYHIGLRVLHWLIAVLMLGAVVAGFVMEDLPLELKRQVVSLHISVGITVLALAIIRLVMRVTTSVPAIPEGLHSWQGKAGRAVHYLFYVTMLAIPVSGYLMVAARGKTPSWFGLDLPVLVAPNETLADRQAEFIQADCVRPHIRSTPKRTGRCGGDRRQYLRVILSSQ